MIDQNPKAVYAASTMEKPARQKKPRTGLSASIQIGEALRQQKDGRPGC